MARQSIGTITFRGTTVDELRRELQSFANLLTTRLDEIRGHRGHLTFYADVDANGKRLMGLGDASAGSDAVRRDQTLVLNRQRGMYEAGGAGITDLPTATESAEAVPLRQILDLIGRAVSLEEPVNPPPKVADASDISDRSTGFAFGEHTHQGVNLDEAQTITGAKTFDLDPAAPFAVSSGSALVANLDADKWDGEDYSTGTFTVTATGFDATVDGTASYVKLGSVVLLYLPTLTGTSDATTFTLTGIPAAIQAVTDGELAGLIVTDNVVVADTGVLGIVASSGTWNVYPTSALGLWTGSGAKALRRTWIAYHLL